MIRAVVLDRHPATCAGVNAILNEHAGVIGVGTAADRQATPDRELARTVGLDPRALQARLAAIVSGAAVGPLDRASELHAG